MNFTILLKECKKVQFSNKHCSCISQSEIIFSHVGVVMDQNQIDVRTDGRRSKDIESDLVKGKSPYPPNKSADNVRLQSEDRVNKCNQCSVGMYPPMQAI